MLKMSPASAVIGIQCRLSSSRLPCKALLELADTTVLGMCIERAVNSGYPVFLLTSDLPEDNLIAESGLRHRVDGVIRGSLDNVLSRYVNLAEKSSSDYIVRVTADNPLTEYSFVDPLIQHISLHDLSYAWIDPSLCPEGTNVEVFSKQILFESSMNDHSKENLEHVTSYMRTNLSSLQCLKESVPRYFPFDCTNMSFTIDTLTDYVGVVTLVNSVVGKLGIGWRSPEFVQACAEFVSTNPCSSANGRNHTLQ